jgi:hypothetical protein
MGTVAAGFLDIVRGKQRVKLGSRLDLSHVCWELGDACIWCGRDVEEQERGYRGHGDGEGQGGRFMERRDVGNHSSLGGRG